MHVLRRAGTRSAGAMACLLLASACGAPAPAVSDAPTAGGTPASSGAPTDKPATASPTPSATSADPNPTPSITEADDPAEVLTGRAAEAVGQGIDAVMRIGLPGFRIPDPEWMHDVDGNRVLTGREGPDGNTRLIVRDLEGLQLREIESGIEVPQRAIIRGDAVYFGGLDLDLNDPLASTDLGAWVARGDAPPVLILPATEGFAIYHAFELSPDGRTLGISRCAETACATYLIGPDDEVVEIPKAGLIALTNDAALLIGLWNEMTAYAVADGAELWHAETDGYYYERYATPDGRRIVMSSLEDATQDDGNSSDQLRIEVIDGLSGTVEQAILLPKRYEIPTISRSLSTDRYAVLVSTVIPNPDKAPQPVQVVDLVEGRLLDVELTLGAVP